MSPRLHQARRQLLVPWVPELDATGRLEVVFRLQLCPLSSLLSHV